MVMRLSFLYVLFLAIGTFAPCQTFFAPYARTHTQTKAAAIQIQLHSDAPTFESAFSQQMPSWLVQRCAQLGFKSPTIVQETALVHIFAGKDVVLQAQVCIDDVALIYNIILPLIFFLMHSDGQRQNSCLLPSSALQSRPCAVCGANGHSRTNSRAGPTGICYSKATGLVKPR